MCASSQYVWYTCNHFPYRSILNTDLKVILYWHSRLSKSYALCCTRTVRVGATAARFERLGMLSRLIEHTGHRTDPTNAIDEFTADSRGFTKSSRGYTRMYGGFADGFTLYNGFTNGFAMDSREFARVREGYADGRWIHNGYTADSRVDADSRMNSQWVHKGSYPMFTVHRCESVWHLISHSS